MPYSVSQYEATTRRRPGINYGDIITAEAPAVRQRYFDSLGYKQEEKALDESRRQHQERMAYEAIQQELQKKSAEAAKRYAGANLGYTAGSAIGGAAVGGAWGGPIGAVVGYVASNWTHICSTIHNNIPKLIDKLEMQLMFKLRLWIKDKYPVWVKFYDKAAPIAIYNCYKKLGYKKFLNKLSEIHKGLFTQIPELIRMDEMQSAFEIYKEVGLDFILENAPRFKKAAEFAEKQEG